MRDLLWVVDMQKDFVEPTGRLAVPGALGVVSPLHSLVSRTWSKDIPIVFSADDHELDDPEIVLGEADPANGLFNPHCMRGTEGAMLMVGPSARQTPVSNVEQLDFITKEVVSGEIHPILLKKHFDVFTNTAADKVISRVNPDRILVTGVATDICVNAAVTGMLDRGYRVAVVEDCIAGLIPENVDTCLANWNDRGVEFVRSRDLDLAKV